MTVEWKSAWLSWVASTTTCLNALGVKCDVFDVAGMSGYAFIMTVHECICPSGPTMFNWGLLEPGITYLGRSTLTFKSCDSHTEWKDNPVRIMESYKQVYNLVAREVAEGRPCVIWGTYDPEFGVVIGVDDMHYIVKTYKPLMGEEEPPIPFDKLNCLGSMYVLAFPTTSNVPQQAGDHAAISAAAELLMKKRSGFRLYENGLKAYDQWIRALKAGPGNAPCNNFTPFGNTYNSQCYAEAKSFALVFLKRVAERNPSIRAKLEKAVDLYQIVADEMIKMAKLFPFPPKKEIENEKSRSEAITALNNAKVAETKAVDVLIEVSDMGW